MQFSSSEIKRDTPRYIEGFHAVFPERKTYFGELCDSTEDSPLRRRLATSIQSTLFDEDLRLIEMSVSDFILAHKCPKVFDGYFNNDFPFNHPHHTLFDIGTCVDKIAKEYLRLPIEARSRKQSFLRNQLLDKISKFSLDDAKERELSDAFDDFCAHFKTVRLANNFDSNKKLVFEFGEFLLGGKIDFLVQEQDNSLTLLDLKLLSVGSSIDNLQFYDFIQAILYAYALLGKNIMVNKIGYYYFLERAFVIQKVTTKNLEGFSQILKEFAFWLARTKDFIPRKCAYCLICELRGKCPIGRHVTRNDFINPLE